MLNTGPHSCIVLYYLAPALDLKRGKAADIAVLAAEHLQI